MNLDTLKWCKTTFVFLFFFSISPDFMMRSNSKHPFSLTGEKAADSSTGPLESNCECVATSRAILTDLVIGIGALEVVAGAPIVGFGKS